jgi:hypothetical protein
MATKWKPEEPDTFDGKTVITEKDLAKMGWVPSGKLYSLNYDKDVFVLLTDSGKAITLRTD